MKTSNIFCMPTPELTDQDIIDLFMGLVRLVKRQYQTKIDTMQMEIDKLKLLQEPLHQQP